MAKQKSIPPRLHKFSLNASDVNIASEVTPPLFKIMMRDVGDVVSDQHKEIKENFKTMSEEHASRQFLDNFITGLGNDFVTLISPEQPELVPDFQLQKAVSVALTKSRALEFQQTEKTVPIFGAKTVVEIDATAKTLVSIEASFADRPDVNPVASISPREGLKSIEHYCSKALPRNQNNFSPVLLFFPDQKNKVWRLAYHFQNIPLTPPEQVESGEARDHEYCIGDSPRHYASEHDYFVDAHSAVVFYYFSSAPRLDIPVRCNGLDDESMARHFNGLNSGARVSLIDPIRKIHTYDYGLQDMSSSTATFPPSTVNHNSPQFAAINGPAISAHFNATLVFDFFNDELKRKGIDDKGMVLESVVNVYYSARNPEPAPLWGNAVWYQKKMWYGQKKDTTGKQISFARYLDVIGHELTHGVTETTSALVYRDLSGALNESFSDIFGIFIKNWFPSRPNALMTWNWEMGPGLGRGGSAIRNFSDPAACGQPNHFSQYVPITSDYGGVHKYSGIHNLAAYKVLTSIDSAGNYVFSPNEVAILYYLTLTRLTRISDFSDCRRVLLNVTGVYFAADPVQANEKKDAIKAAYDAVGIY